MMTRWLGVTNALVLLRLLPMSDRDKDAEILALRHQIAILERHLHGEKVRFAPADRAFLAMLLNRLPRDVLRGPPRRRYRSGTPANRRYLGDGPALSSPRHHRG